MFALFVSDALVAVAQTVPASLPEGVAAAAVPPGLARYVTTGWSIQSGSLIASGAALATFRAALLARLAACRWEAQVRGVMIDGKRWHSDAEGRAALVEAVTLSRVWEETYPADRWQTRWKTADGFILVDRAAVIAAGLAVAGHIQSVFNREALLAESIAQGDFETLAVYAAEIEGGW